MENNSRFQFNAAMIVPILGWIYIFVGLIWPFENAVLLWIWWIDIFLSVVVHGIQVFVALPAGTHHGFSRIQTAIYTFIFGATWWRPLQNTMKE
ncbi:MAG: hypothetical protein R3208_09655 [Ketobacteraceae bacterium]|nr:hypothetical protein [Ketobacteraceae bacterium]